MEYKLWNQRKHDVARNFFYEIQFLALQLVPNEKLQQYVCDVQNQAAKRIQKTWRGFQSRKYFQQVKPELKKVKAAIIIQRAWREWLYNKRQKQVDHKPKRTRRPINSINREQMKMLHERIETWNLEHGTDKVVTEHDVIIKQHTEVCSKLRKFYESSQNRKVEEQRSDNLCTQIDGIFSLLQNIPPLGECKEVDWILFQSPLSADAAAARIKHKHDLREQNKAWWKKLENDD